MNLEELKIKRIAALENQQHSNALYNEYRVFEAGIIKKFCKEEKILSQLDWEIFVDYNYTRLKTRDTEEVYGASRLYREIILPFGAWSNDWIPELIGRHAGTYFEFYQDRRYDCTIFLDTIRQYDLKVYGHRLTQYIEDMKANTKSLEELRNFCKIV